MPSGLTDSEFLIMTTGGPHEPYCFIMLIYHIMRDILKPHGLRPLHEDTEAGRNHR